MNIPHPNPYEVWNNNGSAPKHLDRGYSHVLETLVLIEIILSFAFIIITNQSWLNKEAKMSVYCPAESHKGSEVLWTRFA